MILATLLLLNIVKPASTVSVAPSDLQAREYQYTRGVLTSDISLLRDVWDESFVDTDEAGGFATREEQLAKVAKSKVKIVSLLVDQERTDLYGDAAVVTERFRVKYRLEDNKEGEETGRSTDVWVKKDGRWMCVAAHSSALSDPQPDSK
jgi:ketosteroid isomerase-like protein